jgi:hypothetical protein
MQKIQIQRLTFCFFILFAVIFLKGCRFSEPIPDYCDPKSGCTLDSCKDILAVPYSEPKNVYVCACKPWNSSGILVKKGEVYKFELKELKDWVDGKSLKSTPNQGWQGFWPNVLGTLGGFYKRSDEANWYALVGSIGRNEEKSFAVFNDSDDATVSEKTMIDNGELYFFANDMKGRYGNNRGRLKISITLIKRPK